MYCPKCGAKYGEQDAICGNCGAPRPKPVPAGKEVPNHLVWAILVTVCCCMPFGALAIIQSIKVDQCMAAGEYEKAAEYSKKVKTWCWIGLGLGFVVNFLVLLLYSASFIMNLSK